MRSVKAATYVNLAFLDALPFYSELTRPAAIKLRSTKETAFVSVELQLKEGSVITVLILHRGPRAPFQSVGEQHGLHNTSTNHPSVAIVY